MKKIIALSFIVLISISLTSCIDGENLSDEIANDALNETSIEYDAESEDLTLDQLSDDYGSIGALNGSDFSIEDMLIYAIQDEFAARAEYDYIINEFNTTTPYSNIIKSEETHIELLLPLFEAYGYVVPDDTSHEHLIEIDSLLTAAETGVIAEINNIAMYNLFLEEELPVDIYEAFVKLRDASLNHLSAFEKQVDKLS
jgi:hypothetical protein